MKKCNECGQIINSEEFNKINQQNRILRRRKKNNSNILNNILLEDLLSEEQKEKLLLEIEKITKFIDESPLTVNEIIKDFILFSENKKLI